MSNNWFMMAVMFQDESVGLREINRDENKTGHFVTKLILMFISRIGRTPQNAALQPLYKRSRRLPSIRTSRDGSFFD